MNRGDASEDAAILAYNANKVIKNSSCITVPEDCDMTPASVSKYTMGKGLQYRIILDKSVPEYSKQNIKE